MFFKHLQGWRLYHCPGQPGPMPDPEPFYSSLDICHIHIRCSMNTIYSLGTPEYLKIINLKYHNLNHSLHLNITLE